MSNKFPTDVFTSLRELLSMERYARNFSLLARKQKVKSILAGKHASKLRGRGLDFEEVRQYVNGDDIRNIDWKVTARTQETHTRVFSEEKEKPALIIVDQSSSMFFGSVKRTKSVVAAELAAIAGFSVLKQGDRVGGVVFSENGVDIIFPKRDRRNMTRFLEKIVTQNNNLTTRGERDFQELLKEVMNKVRNIVTHDFLIIVIADFHRYSPSVVKYLAQIARNNDVLLAKIFDPMEKSIPSETFIAGNSRQQITVKGTSKTIRERYSGGYEGDLNSFQSQMKKHRIPMFSINTVDPIDQQLKDIFIGQKH